MTLVPVRGTACPLCGAATFDWSVIQAALFRHGGYGETTAFDYRRCSNRMCADERLVGVRSLRPGITAA